MLIRPAFAELTSPRSKLPMQSVTARWRRSLLLLRRTARGYRCCSPQFAEAATDRLRLSQWMRQRRLRSGIPSWKKRGRRNAADLRDALGIYEQDLVRAGEIHQHRPVRQGREIARRATRVEASELPAPAIDPISITDHITRSPIPRIETQ